MLFKSRRSYIAATLSILLTFSFVAASAAAMPTSIDFSLRTLDGQRISSTDLHGQVVVLAFGASWLPLTRKQIQGVRKLADQYAGRGVAVYFVSTDSDSPKSKNFASDEQLRDYARRSEMNVTILRDPDGTVSKQLGVDQIPAIVILDKQGNVSGAPINGFDPNGDLVDQVAPHLNKVL
jgi:peroxiredoxin